MFVDIVSVRDCAFGPHHPATAVALAQLATSYRIRAKHDFNFHDEGLMLAKNALRRALTIKEHLYGKNSLKLATTLINFAKLYSDTHDYKRAEPVMQRAYDIRTSVLELASVISHRGRYDEAKEMLLECLDDIVAICGKDNPKTDKVFRNYVFTATEEGVHDLELHFGSRKVEIEEVPPYRYIWERIFDAIKGFCVSCGARIKNAVKRKWSQCMSKRDNREELDDTDDNLEGKNTEKRKNVGGIIFGNAKESNKVSPSEDDESKSSIPDRRRTMMFDRPVVNP
eukprot:g13275.t1